MSGQPALEAVEAASAAFDRLLAVDLSGLSDAGDLLPLADEVEVLARKVAVVQQRLVAVVVERQVPQTLGATPVELLRRLLRLSPGEAKARVARAEDLSPRRTLTGEPLPAWLPATAAAQAEGVLSVGHVRVIQHTMRALPDAVDPQTWARAEEELASRGREFDPKDLATVATRLRACLDPDGTLTTERKQVERRELTFARDVDGSYRLRGRLDPEGAEIVKVAVDSLAAPAPAEDGTADPRSPGRRQADALVELARRAVAGGELPDSGGRPTQVLVMVNLADLQAKAGLADLAHTGATVSAETALRMACDAEIVPTLVGDGGRIHSVGRARRLATKAQRDALIARDRGHHIVHWAHGGTTDLDNLILLCGRTPPSSPLRTLDHRYSQRSAECPTTTVEPSRVNPAAIFGRDIRPPCPGPCSSTTVAHRISSMSVDLGNRRPRHAWCQDGGCA